MELVELEDLDRQAKEFIDELSPIQRKRKCNQCIF